MTTHVLKTVVFMGSAKDISPPWGGPSRLGNGIFEWVKKTLQDRTATCGPDTVSHEITVYDPLEVFAADGPLAASGGELKHPHFYYAPGTAPAPMEAMAVTLRAADCFIIVTPEYNHSIPPALSSLMGHFGSSCYGFKPSGIITYSPGPFGGARAAVALRPFLSELGCLPVSKLACFPSPDAIFAEDGSVIDPESRLLKQMPAMLRQLEWFAIACKKQRELAGTP